jgi:hypothetical protein
MTPSLNSQIQSLRPGHPATDWENDTAQAIALLAEVSSTGRQWDIFIRLEAGQVIYEITNIFMIDEDGITLLVQGWPAGDIPVDVLDHSLPRAACRAYLAHKNRLQTNYGAAGIAE